MIMPQYNGSVHNINEVKKRYKAGNGCKVKMSGVAERGEGFPLVFHRDQSLKNTVGCRNLQHLREEGCAGETTFFDRALNLKG